MRAVGDCWRLAAQPSTFPTLCVQAADCKLSCCRFNWVEGPNAGAPENQQPSNRLELRLPAAVQDEAPSVSVHRLLSALAGSLPPLAVSELQYGGPPQLVQQLLVCSQLRGVSRLTLHAPGTVSLQNVSLPALRALACGWQSFADSTSLSLQSVQLPALTRLAYDGSGGSLRMDGCTLPQLAQLEPTRLAQDSGDKTLTASISIAACALLALQQLSLSTRQLCLTGVQLPALTALRLTTGQWAAYSVGRELLIDGGSLPVLQTLEASGFSNVSLQTELPSLTSLELRALPDSSTAESAQGALPALRSVVLAGERCVLLAHTPAVLAWLAGLPPLHRLVLKHLRLPDNLPDGPWLSGGCPGGGSSCWVCCAGM